MDSIPDEDRRNRLTLLKNKIRDPQGKGNIDSLLDTVQALYTDCDHPGIKKLKNVEVYLNRCKYKLCKNRFVLTAIRNRFLTIRGRNIWNCLSNFIKNIYI